MGIPKEIEFGRIAWRSQPRTINSINMTEPELKLANKMFLQARRLALAKLFQRDVDL